jgi:NAD(P)-dependent dehydrogenase (short-subunit alcohol dehydrogenase family)
MRAQGRGGSIINTASIAGLSGGAGPHAYSAAKAAVINLTRSASAEFAGHRIRVNAIAPGMIKTPLAIGHREEALDRLVQQKQPWPEAGMPQHIADTALFLAGEDSRFVTGQVIVVDGGLTAQGPDLFGHGPSSRMLRKAGLNTGTTGLPGSVREVRHP